MNELSADEGANVLPARGFSREPVRTALRVDLGVLTISQVTHRFSSRVPASLCAGYRGACTNRDLFCK